MGSYRHESDCRVSGRFLSSAARRWRALSGILVVVLVGICAEARGGPLKAGTEVFAVDPARVIEVSYQSSEVRLIAYRWDVHQRFTLIFLEKSRAQPVICPAGAGFAAVLAQLTSLKLTRTLNPGESEAYLQRQPIAAWAEVAIRDNSALPPFQARITPLAGSSTEALTHFNGATYIVACDAEVFRRLGGGCTTLGTGKNQDRRPE
jgi:hypothetical protein